MAKLGRPKGSRNKVPSRTAIQSLLETKRKRLQRELGRVIRDNLDFHLVCMNDDSLSHAERFLHAEALDKYTLSVPTPEAGQAPAQQTFTWLDDSSPVSAAAGSETSTSAH